MKLSELREKLKNEKEIYFKVKVMPGMSATKEDGEMADGALKINLRAQAKNGEANKALIGFLAKELDSLRENVILISGKMTRIKLVKVINRLL